LFTRGYKGTFVIPNKLLGYYESLVSRVRTQTIDNPHLREYVAEIRDVWEQRVILRELRTRAGIPICRGAKGFLLKPLFHSFRGRTFHRSVGSLKVIISQLGGEAGTLGAAMVMAESLLPGFL
jgi:hypothetical protein